MLPANLLLLLLNRFILINFINHHNKLNKSSNIKQIFNLRCVQYLFVDIFKQIFPITQQTNNSDLWEGWQHENNVVIIIV